MNASPPLIFASLSVLLAACGGGGGDAGSTSAATSPVSAGTTAPPASGSTAKDSGRETAAGVWSFAANENEVVRVSGSTLVRYGVGNSWVELWISGEAPCSNAFFGFDPAVAQVKRCEAQAMTAAASPAPAPAPGWTTVAAENQSFVVNGTAVVRYGGGSSWTEKTVSGAGQCSNGFFGFDPLWGQVKHCEVQGSTAAAAAPSPAPAPAPAPAPGWTAVASENQSFFINGSALVRYGAGDSWLQATLSGTVQCNNGWFGGDPAWGQVKRCEVQQGSAGLVSAAPAPAPAPAPTPAPAVPAPSLGNALGSARVFISGHSLVDDPLGGYMASIAQSLSTPMWWNEQISIGSTIQARSRGGGGDPTFGGYRTGKNIGGGSNMNVVAELLNPQTIAGQRYDTLVLTERHDLVGTLLWEDTVRYARHYHDRLVAGNSNANSYVYHSWLGVADKNNPWSWINYERAVAPAWQCVAARVSTSLAAEGRPNRMTYLPAGLALANLVEQANQSWLPGISGGSAAATHDRLFSDDVHLKPLGAYYMALVTYASVYRRSPAGAWAPPEVSAEQAQSLQQVAWQSVANYYASAPSRSMAECQSLMVNQVCPAFVGYKGMGGDYQNYCASRFSQQSQDNPFYFDYGSDAWYWYPAPQ